MSKEEKQEKQKANIDSSLRILLNLRIRIKNYLVAPYCFANKESRRKKIGFPYNSCRIKVQRLPV